MQIQKGVQTDQLKAAVERVRDAAIDKKPGLAGLLDYAGVGTLGGLSNRSAS